MERQTNSNFEDRAERVLENFDIEKLSREDDGDYFVDRFAIEEGIVVAEYVNKKTGIIERCLKIEFGVTTAETTYDSETGKLKEIREYRDDGNIESFVDAEALSQIQKRDENILSGVKEINDNMTAEEYKIFKDIRLFEDLAFQAKRSGQNPDIKH